MLLARNVFKRNAKKKRTIGMVKTASVPRIEVLGVQAALTDQKIPETKKPHCCGFSFESYLDASLENKFKNISSPSVWSVRFSG